MARTAHGALTAAEAKARFRDAAGRASLDGMIRRNPYTATFIALTAGLLAGGSRRFPEQLSGVLMAALPGLFRRRGG